MIKHIGGGAAVASLAALLGGCFDVPSGESAAARKTNGAEMVATTPATSAPVPSPAPAVVATPPPGAVKMAATAPSDPKTLFATECGGCHMPYPAGLLPVRSWQAIMSGLSDHFGENASLDPDAAQQVGDYLLANAADAKNRRSPVLRGLAAGDVPLRITRTPWWKGRHGEVSAGAFKRANVKSASNCVACHGPGAINGVFGDD